MAGVNRVLVKSTTGRAFRRGGLVFSPEGVEINLDALDADVRAAVTGESRLAITPIDAPEGLGGSDPDAEIDEPEAPDLVAAAAAPRKKVKRT